MVTEIQTKVKFIASNRSHTVIIDENNECYSWGCGKYGKLGHRDVIDLMKPRHVKHFLKNIKDEIEDDEELKRKKKSSLTVLQRNESLHNDEKD